MLFETPFGELLHRRRDVAQRALPSEVMEVHPRRAGSRAKVEHAAWLEVAQAVRDGHTFWELLARALLGVVPDCIVDPTLRGLIELQQALISGAVLLSPFLH